MTACVWIYFPAVAQRYQRSIDWHKENNNIQPHFGLFWNFCINSTLGTNLTRVHCKPHADRKNIAGGVCALFVYSIGPSSCFSSFPICIADEMTFFLLLCRTIQSPGKIMACAMGGWDFFGDPTQCPGPLPIFSVLPLQH